MGMTISKPYRFIVLSEDIEEVKKMRKYNNQVIPNKSTAIAVDTNEQFIFQDGKWRKMTIKMTIDTSLEWLSSRKEHYEMDDNCQELAQALDTAIDTMRKYQKIEQIMESDTYKGIFTYSDDTRLNHIREVLEDGKTD